MMRSRDLIVFGVAIFLLGSLPGFSMNSGVRSYIPEAARSLQESKIVLEYSLDPGSNRPSARLKFSDGFEIQLNAVCQGDYTWCVRIWEDGKFQDAGSLKMDFHDDGILEILTRIPHDKTYGRYKKYFELVSGRYKPVNSGSP